MDFTKIDYKYNLNAGDTVQIAGVMSDTYTIIHVESLNESVAKAFSQGGKFFMTGVSAGTAFVKAIFKVNGVEDDSRYYYRCDVTVTGSSSGGGSAQNTLTDFLTGAWTHYNPGTYGTSSGTMTLNANKTGHITAYLKGSVVHNKDFTWAAYETRDAHNKLIKILSISGTGSSSGAIDGDHTITTGTNSFTMNCNFGFGMPNPSEWSKQ